MKVKSIIAKVFRILASVLWALMLLITGLIILLYSSWAQDIARQTLLAKMNNGTTQVSVDYFRLRFPLSLEAGGIAMISNGDTLVAAESLNAKVALLPLLIGEAQIDEAELRGARYVMGSPDSAMYMVINADSLGLAPVSIGLSDMSINLENGAIRGGDLSMTLNNKIVSKSTEPSKPTEMSIAIGNITLDDFTYTMRMMPTIDTLSAYIAHSELAGGKIDLLNQHIQLGTFGGDGLNAKYIVPDSAAIAAFGQLPESNDTTASAPWVVEIDSINFSSSHALYTTAGVEPLPGLDFTYIEVDNLDLKLHNFYNRATTVRLPISLTGKERCGVDLSIDGTLDIDSVALKFNEVHISTPVGTDASFEGILGMGDMMNNPSLPLGLRLDGAFSPKDISMMFPAFSAYLAAIPSADDILLDVDASGTTGNLSIEEAVLRLNNCVTLKASGNVENMMNPDILAGNVKLSGNIINVNSFKRALLDPATAKSFNIPPMTLAGDVRMTKGIINGNLSARTGSGALKMKAMWNGKGEAYDLALTTNRFPVHAFMPLLGVGDITADAKVKGHGYTPFKKSTAIDAHVNVTSAQYLKVLYTDIKVDATLSNGIAEIELDSSDPKADMALSAKGNLDGKTYVWTAKLDGRYIDLYALGLTSDPSSLETVLDADATMGPGKNDIQAHLVLKDLFYRQTAGTIGLSDVDAHFNASDSLTSLKVVNRDLIGNFDSPASLDTLMARFSRTSAILSDQLKAYQIDADTLGKALPPFVLNIHGGKSNLVNDILAASKMSVKRFSFTAENDSNLEMQAFAERFNTGSLRLDSLYLNAHGHGDHLHLNAGIRNLPGNLNEWHAVTLKGVVDGNQLALGLSQQNLKGKTGYEIGMLAEANAADTTITLHIKPFDPIIGYQQWKANEDNFISYTIPTQHIDANLRMEGGNSSIAIYTESDGDGHDAHGHTQEDLIVKLGDIHLQDWISMNPFAPPMKGDINADMRLNRHDGILTGQGSAGISNFIYGKEKVADFKADFNVAANPSGTINADADVYVNGVKTMTLNGALNDSTATSPLSLDFSMIRFPLATANPFFPPNIAKLSGVLNGNLKITGTDSAPIYNGTLDFDSTAVALTLTGTDYRFSSTPIEVKDNIVNFNAFTISGCNDNPLQVDGTVDLSNMSNLKMNLSLKADNMMVVNSNRASRGADIYGKGYISLNANAHGSMQLLNVNADLSINPGTNVTYVIPDATSALSNKSTENMVKFVNFTDSAAVAAADTLITSGMAMFLDAKLTIMEGTFLNVFLSADGKNRAQIQSNGTLTYTMSPLDSGRLSGRLSLDKGFVRYTPPFMSEKLFNFQDGSYVAFTGNMMNPTLNIKAIDVLKANVTQEGQNSRLVNFDVLLSVTGTLEKMNVAFDLSTNDDVTVANELESMSAEQRANQAMNLLLYNVYTGPGTKGTASLSGNPLFSFLESQINTWAANNIKGVDLSFGIDQYDRTVNGSSSTTTSYSYQVSKSLFNDRFKIVVGGNYSTDANADENFSQNLINDISFEYFLNDTRTMYIRLFRHTGYESILEGEITQTGVGFVYRRKLRRLGDMFLPAKLVQARLKKQLEKESTANETDKDK